MAQITSSAQNALSEIHGMMTTNFTSKSEITGLSNLTFTAQPTGLNKGLVEVELINTAGTTVKKISGHYDSNLSVMLSASDSTSGDNSSTSTQINWSVAVADFSAGKIKMTCSGKIQQQDVNANGLTSTSTGNGVAVVILPFSVAAGDGGDGGQG